MLNRFFKRSEFRCQCNNCNSDVVDAELLQVLTDLRLFYDRPVIINSGHRCVEHNMKVGGSLNSQHLTGKAADIVVKGVDSDEVYRHLDELYHDTYGIGKYVGRTHIDVRERRARWDMT